MDMSIPSQRIIRLLSKLSIARLTFKAHHPRALMMGRDPKGTLHMPENEAELVFQAALTIVEVILEILSGIYSPHLLGHFCYWPLLDAIVYVTSELRRRVLGKNVNTAWYYLETLYEGYGHVVLDEQNTFATSLGDLVLEAWEARSGQLFVEGGGKEVTEPSFVGVLKEKRQGFMHNRIQDTLEIPLECDMDMMETNLFDTNSWQYWNNLLAL